MTTNEIIYDIKERIQIDTDDRSFDFPEPHILFVYEESRATVLSRRLTKAGRMIDTELFQTVRLEMEMVDRSFCPAVPIGCKVLRSKVQLSSALLNSHGHAIVDRVGGNDILSKKYKFIEYSSVGSIYGGKFSHKYVYVFILGGYLYLISKNKITGAIENLVLRGVFEEPSKIAETGQCMTDCERYPIKMVYQNDIVQMTIQKLMSKFQIPPDIMNDSGNAPVGVSQPKKA